MKILTNITTSKRNNANNWRVKMPNHVTTKINASKEVLLSMLNSDGDIDFEMIIPYPDSMKDTVGMGICMSAEKAAELVCNEPLNENPLIASLEADNRKDIDVTKLDDDSFDQFVVMVINKKKTGYYHKMDFNREVWGTKWNAYDHDIDQIDNGFIKFDTAWSHPDEVLKALSLKFPSEEIRVEYADEDTGSNCGYYTIINGCITSKSIAPKWCDMSDGEKSEWTKFAFTLRYPNDDPKEFGYDESWVYCDE